MASQSSAGRANIHVDRYMPLSWRIPAGRATTKMWRCGELQGVEAGAGAQLDLVRLVDAQGGEF